jgi:hypothetical protein
MDTRKIVGHAGPRELSEVTVPFQQLQQKESQKAPPSPQEIKAVEFLHNDAQMRAAFINKVAAPIANKLFECGLIP